MSTEYSDPRPDTIKGRVRIALMELHREHQAAGMLPTSCRFLFYELVARGIITKGGNRPDQPVIKALTQLREQGLIPWEDIVDETREVSSFTGSATVADDLLGYVAVACLDPWDGEVPFILTESRSLAGVLRDICNQYRCRIASTNGQVRGFLHTKVLRALGPESRIGYLGDFDLSGGHIEENTRRVLESELGPLDWRRLALTEEQVAAYRLPTVNKSDKRYRDGEGDHEAVETEALSQSIIVGIVREWLDGLLPQPLEEIEESEAEQRKILRLLIESI
jgi:hypothetical protein